MRIINDTSKNTSIILSTVYLENVFNLSNYRFHFDNNDKYM